MTLEGRGATPNDTQVLAVVVVVVVVVVAGVVAVAVAVAVVFYHMSVLTSLVE